MGKDIKHHWKNVLIGMNASIFSAIKQMDEEALRVLLVVDEQNHLLGIITDGDIRRYLLKQESLDKTVEHVMNKNPMTASIYESQDQMLMKMHTHGILHLPIVNDEYQIIDLATYDSLFLKNTHENVIIFMAGGMGKRLYPLTMNCPKPLIKIGTKPIAEILLENFIKNGFKNYYFSINYKGDMIRDYFGSGERWGVNIQYIEENSALGTAGSLSLLPTVPDKPFFVINADILTNVNLSHLLNFHQNHIEKVYATLCVRQYQNVIPFGVVKIHEKNHKLIDIEEKPIMNFFVNAGIYILEPEILKSLNFDKYCDMPDLLMNLVRQDLYVSTFPIREYWLDIGHHDNLVKATEDYLEIFC